LSHVLRLHNLPDSILHFFVMLKIGPFCPFGFAFTKIKQKNETTNKCRENLRINNLNLRFHICKSKEAKSE